MFPRSNRFPATKPSEVPGPGTYNPQDPQANYKHGAFLEKADRFDEDKPSEVPGPGAYTTEQSGKPVKKAPAPTTKSQSDRYAILQKKLEDLERVHLEGKKSHQVELERLKQELSRALKSCTEQTDQLAKARKQNDTLDARVQELKKANTTDQTDLKDLRVKFRLLEHERTQLVAKQGEAGETKKALSDLDAKRRDELRERDRRIAELERSVAAEKRRRESAEARFAEVNGKVEGKAAEVKETKTRLEARIAEAAKNAENAHDALAVAEEGFEEREEELLEQLESVRTMLKRAAEEYGRLASSSVPTVRHTSLKRELVVAQSNNLRLERKLANAEDQVLELAYLIRQYKEQNGFLDAQLRDAEDEAAFHSKALRDVQRHRVPPPPIVDDLRAELADLRTGAIQLRLGGLSDAYDALRSADELQDIINHHVHLDYSILARDLRSCQREVHRSADQVKEASVAKANLTSQLQALQATHSGTEQQLEETTARVATALGEVKTAKQQAEAAESRLQEESSKHAQALQREKETTRKMSAAVQKSKAGEEALQAEIEQLTSELIDAIPYQEAFSNLQEEVGALIARNALAEEEAEKLGRFNAEIIGHNNPSQRIMYVDRVRRELADTKQRLLLVTRDQEAVMADAEELRHELDLYKSVAVPAADKPRTGMTRVGRMPLLNQSLNARSSAMGKSTSGTVKRMDKMDEEYLPGDLTVDDLQ